jgi:hypothetical protein
MPQANEAEPGVRKAPHVFRYFRFVHILKLKRRLVFGVRTSRTAHVCWTLATTFATIANRRDRNCVLPISFPPIPRDARILGFQCPDRAYRLVELASLVR